MILDEFPDLLARLKQRYAEAGRHYHTWSHIEAMLGHYDDIASRIASPEAVLLAIQYHDAIYDPTAKDNERRSAELLRYDLDGLTEERVLDQAVALILATEEHALPASASEPLKSDCQYFLDMDLSILGAPGEVYAEYALNIRKEYGHVGEPAYRAGRSKIMGRFLARERLYFPNHFSDRLEARARSNLAAEIATLGGSEDVSGPFGPTG